MKRAFSLTVLFLLFLISSFSLSSCGSEPRADVMLEEFLYTYGIDGIIYSPSVPEGKDGYITEELFDKIYVYEGSLPENSAIFLNPRTDEYIECAIFITESEQERAAITDMCTERIHLIDSAGKHSFILRSNNVVFYSALPNKDKAKAVIEKILRAYS